mmetsp:Transcript_2600/g.3307  ORF Transcript_2600/g.3307 Transcript_2600/m.3307 type:complete len:237 (+) Transcript_2600:44-754(+)|eukprot:CAMPEP_0176362330 /NCGR_PEP_ID=MMETSP0126-20121128/18356_1 /TAXON_ID=141414 ORGANISM="Strombidinopsis acuminatum, Strain SPMC142" /NCGR_SAMPLE_ID=MMETSP0126 /ASSEMBLY_ACC=CAM_ASM_000229 /LENGTH=236 /DNA_ID=CAMNT_0017718211 /DNA_START=41 /DNA_END=751 /DNA_ORIENTATION=-
MDKIVELSDKIHEQVGSKQLMSALALYGAYRLSKPILFFLKSALKYCVLPRPNHFKRYGGGWALVTGGSDGMGYAVAEELAAEGFNIIILSRNEEKTRAAAEKIAKTYNVETKSLVFDFSHLSNENSVKDLESVLAQVKDLDISILVNNVGYLEFASFTMMQTKNILNMFNVNMHAHLFVSRAILPQMLKRAEEGKKCAIMDVTSNLGMVVNPASSVYGATKAFHISLSRAMYALY